MQQHQQESRGFSLIQDSGAYTSSCGYCNGQSDSATHGMHAFRLTVYDYQELLDQGWRRSGKYLYKPNNKITCCRQYTIRLDVTQHQPSKAQKRLLRKWEQFLAGQLQQQQQPHAQGDAHMADTGQQQQQPQQASSGSSSTRREPKRTRQGSNSTPAAAANGDAAATDHQRQHQQQQAPGQQQQQQQQLSIAGEVEGLLQQAVEALSQQGCLPQQGLPPVKVVAPAANKLNKLPAGTLLTSSCAHALAAAARKQQQQVPGSTVGQPGAAWASVDGLAQLLADSFNSRAAAGAGQLSQSVVASAAKGYINFSGQQQRQQAGQQEQAGQQARQQEQSQHQGGNTPQLPRQKQAAEKQQQAHEQQAPQQYQQQQQQHHPGGGQAHRLQVVMVPNQFIQEEYELYCKYQLQQHHDTPAELTPSRYRNFLVDTPLIPVPPPAAAGAGGGVPPCGYGSFHQQYWLDGKLVAVGVVDVLPRCLSSKYFFWDPQYAWLSLGRYGALREIAWVQEAHAAGAADLRYYYLGYYIHTCPKMAYKAEYAPSELLCPQRQVWVAMGDTVRTALDAAPYVVLSDLPGVQIEPNLSVPRQLPPAAAAARQAAAAGQAAAGRAGSGAGGATHVPGQGGGGGESGAAAAAAGAGAGMPQHLGLQAQIAARQWQRRALDAQLLFLLKQPVRWGALRDSGTLDGGQIGAMEERLSEWLAVVGETAAHLLYVTPSDLLSVG